MEMTSGAGCKQKIDITVPVDDVEQETGRIVNELRAKVQLPGFRRGKVPESLIRSRFAAEIRHDLLDSLVPRFLRAEFERNNLDVVGTPEITGVRLEQGEPLTFTAEFEVSPSFDLGDYRGLEVEYEAPVVSDEEIERRLEQLREQKAEYVNLDPRPVGHGDVAVVALNSLSGLAGEPIRNDSLMLEVGHPETLEDFSRNLLGMEPGEEKEFDVTYPAEHSQPRLAGKTVRFHVVLKAVRRKELPEVNDEFARDLGDYQNLDELRDAIRSSLMNEKEFLAQEQAKNALVEMLVDQHEFPVPEAYVEGQIEATLRRRIRELMGQGLDPRNLKLDWEKIKQGQRERAVRDVKASLLIAKIADREAIEVTRDEVERHVQRIASARHEPLAAVRKELEEEGELPRIATRIRTEKTLSFLFEQARKVPKR